RAKRPPLHQRGPGSERSCRFASSQSESASPGSANLRRRSEMKYARIRICSSNGSAAVAPASGGIETFAFRAVAPFLRAGAALFRFVDARRGVVVSVFTSVGGAPPISAWTILLFLGTELIGVDNCNPFIVHRMVGKQFLARGWRNRKFQ